MKLILRLIQESLAMAWQSLVANRLRTSLSLLGVTIGIFSIIFVLSVVDSLEADMKQSLEMIGSDVLFVQKWPMGPEEGDEEYQWWKYMQRREPRLRDMEKLRDRLEGFSAMAFQSDARVNLEHHNSFASDVGLVATTYQFRETIAVHLESGRYPLPSEFEAGRNYALIGSTVREKLFASEDAVGKEIRVNGLKVIVLGVIRKEGVSIFGDGFDSAIILPIAFAMRLLDPDNARSKILVKAAPGVTAAQLSDEVTASLREVRGVKPAAPNDFSVIESSVIRGMVDGVVGVFNIVGMVIGVFAILVGAFSIANIMFVSVRERTNIIGVQKALGAKNYFILLQFMFESVALCLMGGVAGLFFVGAIILVLNYSLDFEFILPAARILTGLMIAAVVGMVSGIAPALSAARLNPVEAMRAK